MCGLRKIENSPCYLIPNQSFGDLLNTEYYVMSIIRRETGNLNSNFYIRDDMI